MYFTGRLSEYREDILDAYRELKEETSIERNQVQLYQLHTYGAVHRDPRMRVVSVAHVAPDQSGCKG